MKSFRTAHRYRKLFFIVFVRRLWHKTQESFGQAFSKACAIKPRRFGARRNGRNSPYGVSLLPSFSLCAFCAKEKSGKHFLCRYASIILQTFTIPPPRQARHLPLHKGGSAKICSFDCSRKLHQISSCGLDSRQLVAWTHLSLQVCGYLFARWMP